MTERRSAMRWRGYECLYLPLPLLTKEGEKKSPLTPALSQWERENPRRLFRPGRVYANMSL